jgi:hypothetical protein
MSVIKKDHISSYYFELAYRTVQESGPVIFHCPTHHVPLLQEPKICAVQFLYIHIRMLSVPSVSVLVSATSSLIISMKKRKEQKSV